MKTLLYLFHLLPFVCFFFLMSYLVQLSVWEKLKWSCIRKVAIKISSRQFNKKEKDKKFYITQNLTEMKLFKYYLYFYSLQYTIIRQKDFYCLAFLRTTQHLSIFLSCMRTTIITTPYIYIKVNKFSCFFILFKWMEAGRVWLDMKKYGPSIQNKFPWWSINLSEDIHQTSILKKVNNLEIYLNTYQSHQYFIKKYFYYLIDLVFTI